MAVSTPLRQKILHSALCYLNDTHLNPEVPTELLCTSRSFPAGERICVAGQPFKNLYSVQSGSAKDSTVTLSGNEQVIEFYLAGEIIGLDAIHDGKYLCDTYLLEPTTVCIIPFSKLMKHAHTITAIYLRLIHALSHTVHQRTHSLMTTHHHAQQRIAAFLLDISMRTATSGLPANNYYLTMSRHDIGSYLNLSTETVSRMFTQLQDQGALIVHKKHIELINLEKLATLSDKGIEPD